MIGIEFFHKANQDGEVLLNCILQSFTSVSSQEIKINEAGYLKIYIQDPAFQFNRIINSSQAQLNCMDRGTMRKMLALNKIILRRPARESVLKYYDFLIFDLSIISIKQIIISLGKNRVSYVNVRSCPRAAEVARMAAYDVGLDYARVKIALTSGRQYVVVDIEASPTRLRSHDLERLMVRIRRILETRPNFLDENQVKMGADPEFMLFHSRSGRMIAASEFFPRRGRVGYDNLSNPYRHQHPIAEIRPHPSISPLILADNVKAALIRAARMAPYRNIKWVAGSQPPGGFSIGGHIHFSKVKLNYALLRALDNYLAIPVFLIENPHSAVRRRRRYGTLGNYRTKSYGGFEYRTLGSWLISPQITRGVLCLAKIVVSHYQELNDNYLVSSAAQRAFYRGNQEYFRSIFFELWSKICQTALYKEYEQELEKIYTMIMKGEFWNEKQDLRHSWDMAIRFRRTYHPRSIL